MPLPEYEAVGRTLVDSSVRGGAAPVGRGRSVERGPETAEQQLALGERRIAELEALCKARHAGLQIVLAQLQRAEQRAAEAERAMTRDVAELSSRLRASEQAHAALRRTMSWRCTAPLRRLARLALALAPAGVARPDRRDFNARAAHSAKLAFEECGFRREE
jgi:hypothetical protein